MTLASTATDPANRNPRVDRYIADAAPFARPILAHLRHVVHAACPDVVEEKWSMPFFVYRGNLCHLAAFKAHCAFGFWRGKEIAGLSDAAGEAAMGSFGRIGSLDDLPTRRQLTSFVKAAMKLNEGEPRPARKATRRATLSLPDDFATTLAAHPEAARTVRRVQPERQARLSRMDSRSEARVDACVAHPDGDRMDRGRQGAPLEIPAMKESP